MPTSPDESTSGFATRPPSAGWEFVPVPVAGGLGVWAWFRPPAIPQGLSLSLPNDTLSAAALTLRAIVEACGVAETEVAAWSIAGTQPSPPNAAAGDWDRPFPPTADGTDVPLNLWIHGLPRSAPAGAIPAASGVAPSDGDRAFLGRIDADWQQITHLERQLATLRKNLTDMSGKLGSLNRDLTPEEKRLADRQDENAWQDARRWLRDCMAKLSQCLKAQHIGDSSDAGRRSYFEQLHENFIARGLSFEGIESAAREFEQHRKLLHTLQLQMTSALSRAQQDGEGRARRVLAQIAAKKSRRR